MYTGIKLVLSHLIFKDQWLSSLCNRLSLWLINRMWGSRVSLISHHITMFWLRYIYHHLTDSFLWNIGRKQCITTPEPSLFPVRSTSSSKWPNTLHIALSDAVMVKEVHSWTIGPVSNMQNNSSFPRSFLPCFNISYATYGNFLNSVAKCVLNNISWGTLSSLSFMDTRTFITVCTWPFPESYESTSHTHTWSQF